MNQATVQPPVLNCSAVPDALPHPDTEQLPSMCQCRCHGFLDFGTSQIGSQHFAVRANQENRRNSKYSVIGRYLVLRPLTQEYLCPSNAVIFYKLFRRRRVWIKT